VVFGFDNLMVTKYLDARLFRGGGGLSGGDVGCGDGMGDV